MLTSCSMHYFKENLHPGDGNVACRASDPTLSQPCGKQFFSLDQLFCQAKFNIPLAEVSGIFDDPLPGIGIGQSLS